MKLLDTLDMSGGKVTGLGTPTLASDAVTKAYADGLTTGGTGLDAEGVQDQVGLMMTDSTTVNFVYDDVANTETAHVLDSPTLSGQTLAQVRAGIDAATLGGGTRAQVVAEAIAGVVDTAPATLDTLNELAAALGDDANFAVTVNTALAARVRDYREVLTTSATSYTLTHNLGTRRIDVTVRQVGTPYEEVWTTNRATTLNTVDVIFATAPTASLYEVTVMGRPD